MLGTPEIILIIVVLLLCALPAIWGYREGEKRTTGAIGGLLLGLFLGFIGIIIIYCMPKIEEQQYHNFFAQSPADEIQKYKQLMDSGAITEEEYNIQKAKILNR